MIVQSMPNIDIYNEMSRDEEKLKIKARSLEDKVRDSFRKNRRYPAWAGYEYVHQTSHNKYLISFYVESATAKLDIKFLGLVNDDEGNRIVIQKGCWPITLKDSKETVASRFIGYYSPHFFSRYRERIWGGKEMTYGELIGRYFARNQEAIPIKVDERVQRKYKDYGEFANVAFKVKDGMCFIKTWSEGDPESICNRDGDFISVVEYYTLVPESMMSDIQNSAIDEQKEVFIEKLFNDCFR